jgi:hypothetical protein
MERIFFRIIVSVSRIVVEIIFSEEVPFLIPIRAVSYQDDSFVGFGGLWETRRKQSGGLEYSVFYRITSQRLHGRLLSRWGNPINPSPTFRKVFPTLSAPNNPPRSSIENRGCRNS